MIGPGMDRRSLCLGLGWSWCYCRGDSMSRAVGGGRRRCQEVWTSMSTMRPPSSVDGPTHNVNAESRRRQRRFLLGYTAPGEEASHRRRRRRCSSWLGSGGQGPAVWGSLCSTYMYSYGAWRWRMAHGGHQKRYVRVDWYVHALK